MLHVCGHIFRQNLTKNQPNERAVISGDLINMVYTDPIIPNRIITGNETWCYLYDSQTKWKIILKSPPLPKKQTFCTDRSKGKVMLDVFFNSKDTVHQEHIPDGHTVNTPMYILCRDTIHWKHQELWRAGNQVLHTFFSSD
jgi:hypothetical protein